MAGKIHKYEIAENSYLLPGIGPFPEPDFWSNKNPIMAICEPRQRSGLTQGDWVFHVPKKGQTEMDPDYQVTGILKVKEKLKATDIFEDPRFSDEWIRRFKIDLSNQDHVIGATYSDNNTAEPSKYAADHVIGDCDESCWFGRNEISLQEVLDDMSADIELNEGRVRDLEDEEADRLASKLKENLTESKGTPPNAVFSTAANNVSDSYDFVPGASKSY